MEPQLADLLGESARRTDICEAFALLWVAAAEGSIDPRTQIFLDEHLAAMPHTSESIEALLGIIADNDLTSFLFACRVLHRDLEPAAKVDFLRSAIGVAMANQQLSTSANHILRLYSDLLGFSDSDLHSIFLEQTGLDMPEPGDLSSVQWWEARDQRRSDSEYRYRPSPNGRFSRAEAYAILGLEKEAPSAEVKRAYRRLAQSYHPDRYENLGSDAKESAELRFLRVQQAYEVLSQ